MMTYEQKFGRHPNGLVDLEEPPQEWQFEDPLVTVSKDGEVKKKELFTRPKPKPPKMRSISEILSKEVKNVEFIKLDMDKQIKLVADAYNKGLGVSEALRRLGIKGAGTYYNRLDKAKAMGLVAAKGKPPAQKQEPTIAKSATVDDFAKVAEDKLAQAERLAREAQRLQQAGKIAIAVEELLGDKSGRVIAALYAEVSV